MPADWRRRKICSSGPKSCFWVVHLFFVRPSTDWTRPTHIVTSILLYSKSTDLNVLISSKNTFTETSRKIFDQIYGYHGLAKLTHKINRDKRCPCGESALLGRKTAWTRGYKPVFSPKYPKR